MHGLSFTRMRDAARKEGVKHLLLHNYRFLPAVRLSRQLIEEGRLGRIYQFRGRYLQQVGSDPQEVTENVWYATGTRSGVLLGIGCHIIDLALFGDSWRAESRSGYPSAQGDSLSVVPADSASGVPDVPAAADSNAMETTR